MSVKLSFDTPAQNAYNQLRADLQYCDLLKSIKGMASSESQVAHQTNGRNLYLLIRNLYTEFRKNENMLSAFCKEKGYDLSVKVGQESANAQLREVHESANKSLNEILDIDHGITVPNGFKWKAEQVPLSDLLVGTKEILTRFIEQSAKKLGCRVIQRKFQLIYTDIKTGEQKNAGSSQVDCFVYAFYRLREQKAAGTIFFKEPFFPGRSCDDQLDMFINYLGYCLVDIPEKGDLIVYFNEKGQFNHAGVMVDATTVHSKWGSGTDEILEHPVECILPVCQYGYVIFRSPSDNFDQAWAF
jgi:hypothetical protein